MHKTNNDCTENVGILKETCLPFLPLPLMSGALCNYEYEELLIGILEIIQHLQIVSQRWSVEATCKQNIYESLGLMSHCALAAFLEILPSRQGVAGTSRLGR